MKFRRVVTGVNKEGKACIKFDSNIEPIPMRPGFGNIPMWATKKLPAEMTEEDPNTWDLGTSLAYWVETGDAPIFRALGLGITALPGNMTRAELVQAYGTQRGVDVSDAPFYYTFGLFKVAVIAQQIYARHVQGLTSDPRFWVLGEVVKALGNTARTAAEKGRV